MTVIILTVSAIVALLTWACCAVGGRADDLDKAALAQLGQHSANPSRVTGGDGVDHQRASSAAEGE